MTADNTTGPTKPLPSAVRKALGGRNIVLVGMMGAGKSSLGRRLAAVLDLPFYDADVEIEKAAGMTIEDIFALHGEPYFRDGEERVIRRLLKGGPLVLATGGGAVISKNTRSAIAKSGISIWLKAPIQLLLRRASKRDNRPLLKSADPLAVLTRLLAERERYYAEADLVFEGRDAPYEVTVEELLRLLARHLGVQYSGTGPGGMQENDR
jgi:shikimate kinase